MLSPARKFSAAVISVRPVSVHEAACPRGVRSLRRAPGKKTGPGFLSLLFALLVAPHPAPGAPPLHGQQMSMSFTNISVARGLSNGTVNAMARDRSGYMWFGTLDGLCRFDGYEVQVFKHDPGDSLSVGDNTVAIGAMLVDHAGRLWVGTYNNGLDRFDPETGRFVHYRHEPDKPWSLSNNSVRSIIEDRSGVLWIGTFGGGLNRMEAADGRFDHYVHDSANANSLSENLVRCLCEDSTGALWIGTKGGGLNRLDPARKIFTHFRHDPRDPRSMSAGEIWSIYEDAASTLWIGTEYGLNRFERATNTFTRFTHSDARPNSLGGNFVVAMGEDPSGNLWIGTYGGGLDRLVRNDFTFEHHQHNPRDPASLSSNLLRSIFIENGDALKGARHAIWVGTDGTGVDRENTEKKMFALYRNDPGDPRSPIAGIVYAFCEDRRGNLWVGTSTGLCRFVSRVLGRAQFTRFTGPAGGGKGLSNNFVTSMLEDSSGSIWIGTWGGGINVLGKDRRRVEHLTGEDGRPGSLSSNNINTLYEDSGGTLWVGTSVGLDSFDKTTRRFRHYGPDLASSKTVSRDQVRAVLEDRRGDLWIGTDGGLKRLKKTTGELVPCDVRPATRPGDDRIYALYEDRAAILWIGTSNGLERMNERRDSVVRYDAETGLVSSYVRGVTPDGSGNLWLTTTNGLVRFNVLRGTFHHYDVDDGLQGNEFSGASYRRQGGEILIGGVNGFNAFDPEDIADNPHVPPVVLEGFNIFEKPAKFGQPIDIIKTITLRYSEDFFSFAFAALDYTNPAKNSYAYKLEGFDKIWVNAGNRRFAYYTNVSPGEYVFRVKGSNDDGLWNEQGATVRVIVEPPYWQTWWFRTLLAVALISILTLLYNYRVSKLLEMERMRLRISSDLHDDIGSSLSSIALITDMVRHRLPRDLQERQQLSDVSRAARNTADALRDIVWLINPEHEKLDDIILRMKDGASKLLTGIEYAFHCPENALNSVLDMEFRRNVLLMFKEALHNIAKYSRATHVDISIGEEQQEFQMTIADNGIGFDEATITRGNGLNNLRRRAEKIGGNMTITSSPGRGTVVQLRARIP